MAGYAREGEREAARSGWRFVFAMRYLFDV